MLSRSSNIYGAGMLELGMSVSFEQMVIDNDIIGMIQYAIRGIEVNETTLAVDSIIEVGSEGNFFAQPDTMSNVDYPSRPELINRDMFDTWTTAGAKETVQRAHEKVVEILSKPSENLIPADRNSKIDAMIDKKREELLAASDEEKASKRVAEMRLVMEALEAQ